MNDDARDRAHWEAVEEATELLNEERFHEALVVLRDWTFTFGPNVCAGLNALLFGTLLFRSRLVPRWIPTLGLIGGPLMLMASVLTVLGVTENGSPWYLGVVPLATWELSVGIYMAVKGFRPSPLTAVTP